MEGFKTVVREVRKVTAAAAATASWEITKQNSASG